METDEKREATRLYQREYRAANAERLREWRRQKRAANRDEIRARERAARDNDAYRARAIERSREWRAANPERATANARRWRRANPEKLRARRARNRKAQREREVRWIAANPERHRENQRIVQSRRRALKARVTVERVEHRAVFERDQWTCRICGGKTEGEHPHPLSPSLDHIVPLANGGEHSYANTQCTHLRCNLLKGAAAA